MKNNTKKILFVCTEDWFFHSHFLPLVDAARQMGADEIVLATTTHEKYRAIESLGVRIVPVDFERSSLRLFPAGRLISRLHRLFQKEQPDIVHFISLKPVVLGGLAIAPLAAKIATAYHFTGQGLIASKEKRHQRTRGLFLRLLTRFLRRPNSWLFLENPDDGEMLGQYGTVPGQRTTILGGAGVNTDHFTAQPAHHNSPLKLAFVGRLVWSKGVDILIAALDRVNAGKLCVTLDLYGTPDTANPRSVSQQQLNDWNKRPDVNWHGRCNNILGVWQGADIAVVPSRGGEGMPRAMLEAASCARPLVVTDVPGCRHFVRDGVEGLVVPPEDPAALAEAIARLAGDRALQLEMGNAARTRILAGYTERHVIDAVSRVYEKL